MLDSSLVRNIKCSRDRLLPLSDAEGALYVANGVGLELISRTLEFHILTNKGYVPDGLPEVGYGRMP